MSANPGAADEAREALIEALEKAHYPVSDVEANERGDDAVEILSLIHIFSSLRDHRTTKFLPPATSTTRNDR